MKFKSVVILSISLVLASTIFGLFFLNARSSDQTVSVVGYATQNFECDLVKWEFQLTQNVGKDEYESGLQKINSSLNEFQGFINSSKIKTKDINVQPVNSRPQYEEGKIVGKRIFQNVSILSKDLDQIEKIAVNPVSLSKNGISIENSRLKYFKNGLDTLKANLLGKATQNAKTRANKIIENTDLKINKMISASSGVFQITEQYSTRISSHGIHNTSSRKKTIKVTVRATFTVK